MTEAVDALPDASPIRGRDKIMTTKIDPLRIADVKALAGAFLEFSMEGVEEEDPGFRDNAAFWFFMGAQALAVMNMDFALASRLSATSKRLAVAGAYAEVQRLAEVQP